MKALIELLDGSTTIRYLSGEIPPAMIHIAPVTYHHQGTFCPEGTPVYRATMADRQAYERQVVKAHFRSQQHKADHEGGHEPVDE